MYRLQIFLTILVMFNAALVNPTLAAAFWMKVAQAAMVELDKVIIYKFYIFLNNTFYTISLGWRCETLFR